LIKNENKQLAQKQQKRSKKRIRAKITNRAICSESFAFIFY
jgi:hypothetical protein